MVGDPEKTQTEKEDLVLLDEEVLIEETIEVLIGEMIVVVLTDAMSPVGEMIEETIETAEDLTTEGVVLEEEMTTIEGTQEEDLDQDLHLLLKDQALQSAQNHQ
jgi:hypothetical protein